MGVGVRDALEERRGRGGGFEVFSRGGLLACDRPIGSPSRGGKNVLPRPRPDALQGEEVEGKRGSKGGRLLLWLSAVLIQPWGGGGV